MKIEVIYSPIFNYITKSLSARSWVYLCAAPFPKWPPNLLFLSVHVLHWRLLFPAITLLLLMSWVGSPLEMPKVFKAQSGSVPAWGKRMGGWTLENATITNKREKVQKNEWPKWPWKPFVFTLWVWLHVGRHQLGKGTQVAHGACVCFCCGFYTQRPEPDPPSRLQRARV